ARGRVSGEAQAPRPAHQPCRYAGNVFVADGRGAGHLPRADAARARFRPPPHRDFDTRRPRRVPAGSAVDHRSIGAAPCPSDRADRRRRQHERQREGHMKLYSFFRSSAAYRVRIALNLKGISYETASVHLVKDGGHNKLPEFRAVNPQMRVPTLVTPRGDVLIQSLAIIEYLDETHPQPPLLPQDPIARPRVRALAELIACDIHPLNNTSPLRYLKNNMGQEQSAID